MQYHSSPRNIVFTILFSILAALALNACSDTNNVSGPPPLSPDALLSTLDVNPGPLQPVFSSGGANYAVDVLTTDTSVTVTATPQDASATIKINEQPTPSGQAQTIQLGDPDSRTLIKIVVTAVNGSQNTYIVTVNRFGANNANLSNLTVTSGSLSPGFTSNNLGPYSVDVANTVGSVTVTATKSDINATVSINGSIGTSLLINLQPAPSTTQVDVLVIAQDTVTTKTYTVMVNRLSP